MNLLRRCVFVVFCSIFIVKVGNCAVADVLSEIVGSQKRINNAILTTIQENVETSPILRGPERLRKVIVSGSFVPKLPDDGPLALLKPENLSKLLPPNPFGSGDHTVPGPLGLIFNGLPKPTSDFSTTSEKPETTENHSEGHIESKVTDLLPTRTSVKIDLPPVLRETLNSSNQNTPNNLLLTTTKAPIIGRTIPSISLDKKSRK